MGKDDKPIRLVVLDIDGVLTEGEGKALDLELLGLLALRNRAARRNPRLPAFTLATGRPAPYVEALMQAIDGHLPALFEHGAGLYDPGGYRFLPNPALGDRSSFAAVRDKLEQTLVLSGRAFFQPGKEYSLSLFAPDRADTASLHGLAVQALGPLAASVELLFSATCLNVIPRGFHKGQGIEFLCRQTGCPPERILGVGDSDVDRPFLERVGRSAAPANARPGIKEIVHYLAPHAGCEGMRDILEHFGI